MAKYENDRYNQIKERAARVKFTGVYDNQAEIDREHLLDMLAIMESTIELITMEEVME